MPADSRQLIILVAGFGLGVIAAFAASRLTAPGRAGRWTPLRLAGSGALLGLAAASLVHTLALAVRLSLEPAWGERLGAAVALGCLVVVLRWHRREPGRVPAWVPIGVAVATAALLFWFGAPEWGSRHLTSASLLAGTAAALLHAPSRRSELLFLARSSALEQTGDGIVLIDAVGRVLEANEAARAAFARATGAGTAPREILERTLQKLLADPERRHGTFTIRGGTVFEAWIATGDDSGPLAGVRTMVVRDVTRRRRAESRLFRLAHYDSLTGLANRRYFVEQLEATVQSARASRESVGLLYVDLDRFKEINDTVGHGGGDELLRVIAERLRNQLRGANEADDDDREQTQVYRLAGDEFAVLLPNIDGPAAAEQVARRLLRIMSDPVALGNRTITPSGSIGISIFPQDGEDPEALVQHADTALYAAKRLGRSRYEFYDASFTRDGDRKRDIESGLRTAIADGELRLQYQPKIELSSQTVVGFEALLRWNSRDLGVVGPAEFIPVAEERLMIGDIGSWCIAEAVRQLREWDDAGFAPVPISVNVSSLQFSLTDLESVLTTALRESNISPRMLEVELTESALLDSSEATARCLRDLRAIGVRVALDDFGTGYSALAHLNNIPLDALKMDRGFVKDVESSESAAGLAAAVVSIGHSLSLDVIAEGVDSWDQLERLREMGCDQIQGFLFAPALMPDEAARYLARAGEARPLVETSRKTVEPVGGAAEVVADEAERRVLIVDDSAQSLAQVALRLSRLGLEVHYAGDAGEAWLLLTQEKSRIRLLVASPAVEPTEATGLLRGMRTHLVGMQPALVVLGEQPDAATRERVRLAGATRVLWSPFDDSELRYIIKSSMAFPEGASVRQVPRVPCSSIVSVTVASRRCPGLLTNLSARGGFIELTDPPQVGEWVRLEFELPPHRHRVFSRVVYRQEEDPTVGQSTGIGVTFCDLDRDTAVAIAEAVEERAARYVP